MADFAYKQECRIHREPAEHPAFFFFIWPLLLSVALCSCANDDTEQVDNRAADTTREETTDSSYVAPEQTLARVFGIGKFSELQGRYTGGYTLATLDADGLTPATSSGSLVDYGFDWSGARTLKFNADEIRFLAPELIRAADDSKTRLGEISLIPGGSTHWRNELAGGLIIGCEIAFYDTASSIIAIGVISTTP